MYSHEGNNIQREIRKSFGKTREAWFFNDPHKIGTIEGRKDILHT
jgi:hypothetical protein